MTEIALIGKKLGMSREFVKSGQSIPVTIIKMEKGRIVMAGPRDDVLAQLQGAKNDG